jgi:AraC family transcriptional regulator
MPSDPGSRLEYERRVGAAARFIEERLSEDLRLEDVAGAAAFSPYHFHRIFTAVKGESPFEYQRRLRLEKAAALLALRPDLTITRIASETGFSSSSVFARSFAGRFGVSAREYRRRRAGPAPARGGQRVSAALSEAPPPGAEFLGLRRMPELRLAALRHVGEYGKSIGRTWGRLLAWALRSGAAGHGAAPGAKPLRLYGIPLDDPAVTPPRSCRYLAAVPIAEDLEPEDPFELVLVRPSCRAELAFEGGLEDFPAFYGWVYGVWLPGSGHLPSDAPAMEEHEIESASLRGFQRILSREPRALRFSFLLPVEPL